jgi:hydrogenase maturation protein HypF
MSREGHLSAIRLIGGDAASKNAADVERCYRLAAYTKSDEEPAGFEDPRLDIISKALINNINTFECSSMGRLFDAVSALLQTGIYNSYEGECAISLENEALKFMEDSGGEPDYPSFCFNIQTADASIIVDQNDLFRQIQRCKESGKYSAGAISLGFHMAVAAVVPEVCKVIREKRSENKVCLSGGTFNNRIILSKTTELLKKEGFEVFWNRKVPLGDGGISVGQAYYGMLRFLNDKE